MSMGMSWYSNWCMEELQLIPYEYRNRHLNRKIYSVKT